MERTGESGLELLRNHRARPPFIVTLGIMNSATPRSAFSRAKLVIPSAIPIVAVLAMLGLDSIGFELNMHGAAGYLFLLVLGVGLIAFVAECMFVPKAIIDLKQSPQLRTLSNYIAVSFGAGFIVLSVAYVLGVFKAGP